VRKIRLPFRREADGDNDDDNDQRRSLRPLTRRGVLGIGLLLLIVIAFACWLAFEGSRAKSNLEEARDSAQQAKDALLKGDSEGAARAVSEARSHAQKARDATHSPPWNIASVVPWLGSPLKTGQQISDVVLGLTADVLQPAAEVAAVLSPDRLLQGGRVDVQLLRDSEPKLAEISSAARHLNEDANAISEPKYLSALSEVRAELQMQTSDVSGLVGNTALAARLAPSMMGADGPRTYFLGFQTNAEARGTGGLLGAFGILRFNSGVGAVDTLGANDDLNKPFSPIDLGPEFNSQWGFNSPSTDSRNSNFSAHFPYAAEIWKSMWAQQSGTNVDGAIAVDPIALSYILGGVGPVTMPDGEVITKDNVVELTESTVYSRFPIDQQARKNYLQDVASAVVRKMTGPAESPRDLLDGLGKAVSEGRIAVWSSSPTDQQLLEKTPLAHEIPDDPAPYAAVVINNLGGNKLDYYLRREIEYAADSCDGATRKSTVTVKLSNTAPDGPLPDYVASALGLPVGFPQVPRGTNITSVSLIATDGAKLEGALAKGQKVPAFTGTERGHPIFEVQVAIPAGQSGDVKFLLTEPTSPGAPRVPIQPLLDNVTPVISVPQCAG
jgi:hypothetical protein